MWSFQRIQSVSKCEFLFYLHFLKKIMLVFKAFYLVKSAALYIVFN